MHSIRLGTSDFRKFREGGFAYVDKSRLLVDLFRSGSQVLLLPRPRRFGKTLNLSMIRHYVEWTPEDDAASLGKRQVLFADLAVWGAGDEIRRHFAAYPVIWLTFKDVKYATWGEACANIARLVADAVQRHLPTFESALPTGERELADVLLSGRWDALTAQALNRLSAWLHRATGRKVVILVDEYDTPLHEAHAQGYWDEANSFFRNLFSGAFKDNVHLERGVLTGILRVAKESLFSGLNNIGVHTLLSQEFCAHFGFTPAEVKALAESCDAADRLPEIERWYDGYRFGDQVIYNPWSVLNYLASVDRVPRPYWVNTASNDLLRTVFVESGAAEQADVEAVLRGESIEKRIDEHVVLRDIARNEQAMWSFLVFAGYLKVEHFEYTRTSPIALLSVPNLEVAGVLTGLFERWMVDGLAGSAAGPVALCRALVNGDAEEFEYLLSDLLLHTLSYHDLGGRRPEAVYQAFIAGLLVMLDTTHEVTTNRESGRGRYDVLVSPRAAGGRGVVLELKVLNATRGETPEQALDAAAAQLIERDYAANLRSRGAGAIRQWAVVFDGKRAHLRTVA